MHERAAHFENSAVSPRQMLLSVLLVLAAMVPLVLWPGDISWCIDEPRLIAAAWHANDGGHLAAHGLYGNFGVAYGPVPTQIYQLLLAITHDPFTLIVLRALLTGAITVGSLLWLGKTERLPVWFAAALIIAPQVARHHRVLWDASFTIPFGTLALAAFANFLRTRRKWPLRIAVFAAMEIPLIHPQSLPLALPILGYLLWKHWRDLWGDRRGMLWTLGALLALNAKYLLIAFGTVVYRLTHGVAKSYPGVGSRVDSALAPLFGGNFLNGYDDVHKMARPPGPDWLADAAAWAGWLIYPLIWIGIAAALWRLPRAWRAVRSKENNASSRDGLLIAGVAGLFLQMLVFAGLRIPLGPQYYFGTFALHALFAWLGVEALSRLRLGAVAGGAFGLACAYITVGGAYVLHHHGYDYAGWPTMSNAVEVTRALNRFEDTVAQTDIELIQKYPQPIRTVRLLLPPAVGESQRKSNGGLLITYAEQNGKKTGRMIVKELGGAAPPPNSKQMETTPLPEGWVPDPATW